MSSPSEGIRDLLAAANVGIFATQAGWSIQIGKEPISPDQTITIFDSGGSDPSPKWLLDYPSIQLRVRGLPGDYLATRAKALECKNALLAADSQTLNGDRWDSVTMAGDISFLDYDQQDRPRFVLNFRLIIEPASGGNRVAL